MSLFNFYKPNKDEKVICDANNILCTDKNASECYATEDFTCCHACKFKNYCPDVCLKVVTNINNETDSFYNSKLEELNTIPYPVQKKRRMDIIKELNPELYNYLLTTEPLELKK
jgi:hypothetical protein